MLFLNYTNLIRKYSLDCNIVRDHEKSVFIKTRMNYCMYSFIDNIILYIIMHALNELCLDFIDDITRCNNYVDVINNKKYDPIFTHVWPISGENPVAYMLCTHFTNEILATIYCTRKTWPYNRMILSRLCFGLMHDDIAQFFSWYDTDEILRIINYDYDYDYGDYIHNNKLVRYTFIHYVFMNHNKTLLYYCIDYMYIHNVSTLIYYNYTIHNRSGPLKDHEDSLIFSRSLRYTWLHCIIDYL